MTYYLWLNNTQTGPFTIGQIRSMWNAGKITVKTLFWKDGMKDWKPLTELLPQLEDNTAPAVSGQHLTPVSVQVAPNSPSAMISTAYISFFFFVVLTLTIVFAFLGTIPWLVNIILMIVLFCKEHPDAQKAAGRLLFWNIFFVGVVFALIGIFWMRGRLGNEWLQ